ncbi:adhesin, partial [Aliarcobacter trophiarum LMG 25534]
DATTAVSGTFTIAAEAGVESISVDGTTITEAQLKDLSANPVEITTSDEGGQLTITGYDESTGEVSYEYVLNQPKDHSAGEDSVIDTIAITVTDALNQTSAVDTLDILITDSTIEAVGEEHSLTEDSAITTVSGDTLSNEADPFDGDVSFVSWDSTTANYGTVTLNADGTYSYTLDNTNPTVNALNDGDTLTETFTYTVQDGDGTTSQTEVVITINGSTDSVPTVEVSDLTAEVGDNIIAEDATTAVSGTFTIAAEAGVESISVDGTTITEAQLKDLSANPVE